MDSTENQSYNSSRQIFHPFNSLMLARQLKVQAFKKKLLKIPSEEKVVQQPIQKNSQRMIEKPKETPFDQFKRKLESEYNSLQQSLAQNDDEIEASGALQQKIKAYLKNYWFNKIYNRRKNMKFLKIDHLRVQSKVQEEEDKELKTIAKRIMDRQGKTSNQVMQVIKGKVYFLKKGKPPQQNVNESAVIEKEVKRQVRQSQHFTQFSFPKDASQPSTSRRSSISAFHLMSIRRMTVLAQEYKGAGATPKSFLEQLSELTQRINSVPQKRIIPISETSSSSSTVNRRPTTEQRTRTRIPLRTSTEGGRPRQKKGDKPISFFNSQSSVAPPPRQYTVQVSKLMETCKSLISEDKVEMAPLSFELTQPPNEDESQIVSRLQRLYEKIDDDNHRPMEEIGFDAEQPFTLLSPIVVDRMKSNIEYIEKETRRKNLCHQRRKQKQIFIPQQPSFFN